MKQLIILFSVVLLLASCSNDSPNPSAAQSGGLSTEEQTAPNSAQQKTASEPFIDQNDQQNVHRSPQQEVVIIENNCLIPELPEPTDVDYNRTISIADEYARGDHSEYAAGAYMEKSAPMGKMGKSAASSSPSGAGKLTAGELNDFHKWKLWEDLSKNELKSYQDIWQINMQQRYCVMVRNKKGFPMIDAACSLFDKNGNMIWKSRTDNTGKAELWGTMVQGAQMSESVRIKIETETSSEWIDKPKVFQRGINHLKINEACDAKNAVDIVFAVDATGSMGDEIKYLQDELLDVLQKIQKSYNVSLHTGSVFYRDHGDEYVTRISGLTSNMNTTTAFIANQSAGGGGDGPEAVDDALIAGIDQMNWRKSARTRIMFLILDAPPHSSPEQRERLHKAMRAAASKGIRIVPLVASGGGYEMDKSMEYLMRSLALATNGTYVFLTNHIGIGNHHTAPSTDKYKVETLNSILLRVVDQYIEAPGCDQDDWQHVTAMVDEEELIIETKPTGQQEATTITLECYPNPADNQLWIRSSHDISDVYVSDNSGKLMEKIALSTGKTNLNTSHFPSGMYYLKVFVNGQWLSKKFIVLHI